MNLTIIKPQQYRQVILKMIIDEVNMITSKLGGKYQTVIQGLDRPVAWRQASLTNMTVFIPYSFVVVPEGFKGSVYNEED